MSRKHKDWICPKCGNTNYEWRLVCNMRKCRTPRPDGNGTVQTSTSSPVRPTLGSHSPTLFHPTTSHQVVSTGGSNVLLQAAALPIQVPGAAPPTSPATSYSSGKTTMEGDWVCPSCGNNNYAHRTRCNMRKCGSPRPGVSVSRTISALPGGTSTIEPASSPLVPGVSPVQNVYTVSGANGATYIQAASPYHFATPVVQGQTAYYQIPTTGTATTTDGLNLLPAPRSIVAAPGIDTGALTLVQLPIKAPVFQTSPAGFPHARPVTTELDFGDTRDSKRRRTFIGFQDADDWTCPQCGNFNYASRKECNMRKCRAPRPPTSWKCIECGNINYPSRQRCNMRKCGAPRPGKGGSKTNSKTPSSESKENIESPNRRVSSMSLQASHSSMSVSQQTNTPMSRQPGAPDPSPMVLVPTQAATASAT